MLRMVDLMMIVCQWHENQYLGAKVGADARGPGEGPKHDQDETRMFSRNPRTMTRSDVHADMGRMMKAFDVDIEALAQHRDELVHAEKACAGCQTVGRCYRWKHDGGRGDAPELFCPNTNLFSKLAVDPFWAKADLFNWPDDPSALPWLRMLKTNADEASDTPPDVSPSKLVAFAAAAQRADDTAMKWAPHIRRAEDEDQAEELRHEADRSMVAVVEETREISLDEFRSIYHVALYDSGIASELQSLLRHRAAA